MECALLRGYGDDQAKTDMPQACKQSAPRRQDRCRAKDPAVGKIAHLDGHVKKADDAGDGLGNCIVQILLQVPIALEN